MRKIIVISMITLDGVLQAPGGKEEDESGAFKYGGWTAPYADGHGRQVLSEQLGHPFDLLLGRKTYDIWKGYWPQNKDNFIGESFDRATKYVASTTLTKSDWEKTVILKDDVVNEIRKLKQSDGPSFRYTAVVISFKHFSKTISWMSCGSRFSRSRSVRGSVSSTAVRFPPHLRCRTARIPRVASFSPVSNVMEK
jgi:dihydrofolate reductase